MLVDLFLRRREGEKEGRTPIHLVLPYAAALLGDPLSAALARSSPTATKTPSSPQPPSPDPLISLRLSLVPTTLSSMTSLSTDVLVALACLSASAWLKYRSQRAEYPHLVVEQVRRLSLLFYRSRRAADSNDHTANGAALPLPYQGTASAAAGESCLGPERVRIRQAVCVGFSGHGTPWRRRVGVPSCQ